jgi:hypothetical protein
MIGDLQNPERTNRISPWIVVQIILLFSIVTHSVIRDTRLEKQYTGDLRNRVVGARLQKDGKLPYFYSWQTKDGIRYFDPDNFIKSPDSVSIITGSPFFHQLLYPVCDLDQSAFSKLWLFLQYVMLIAMVCIACRLTQNGFTRWLMIYAGTLFTTTEAWKSTVANGQIYFLYAFLMICIISGLLSHKRFWNILAGLIMAAWILNRPIGMLTLPPLILFYKEKKAFHISTFAFLFLYGLFILSSTFEKSLWQNYMEGMRAQVKLHQASDPNATPTSYIVPSDKRMEGIDFNEVNQNTAEYPVKVYSENGNFFVLYKQLTHRRISLAALNCMSGFIIFGLMGIYFYSNKKNKKNLLQVLFFAFTLYMIAEIFSPIHRHQYNTVQWFPLVLTALLIPVARKNPALLLLGLGLLLNIMNVGWIPMRHTLGEFIWLLTLMYLAFKQTDEPIPQ